MAATCAGPSKAQLTSVTEENVLQKARRQFGLNEEENKPVKVKKSKKKKKDPVAKISNEMQEKCAIVELILPGQKETIVPDILTNKKMQQRKQKKKKKNEIVAAENQELIPLKGKTESSGTLQQKHLVVPESQKEPKQASSRSAPVEGQAKPLDLNHLCNWSTTTPQLEIIPKGGYTTKKKMAKKLKSTPPTVTPVKPRAPKIPGCYRNLLKSEELRLADEEKDMIDSGENLGADFLVTKQNARKYGNKT